MQVIVTGGGTAGHVTPLVALSAELRRQDSSTSVVFVGFKGDKSMHQTVIPEGTFNRRYTISAGKLRRYHGVPVWKQVLDLATVAQNLWDIFKIIRGVFGSVRILRNERPDVIFAKGGFVGVPMSIAAKITNTPLVSHDSDTVAGLANRITAKWATVIATGAPTNYYHYPKSKMIEVGVPVDDDVLEVHKQGKKALREELGLDQKRPLVTVVGGTHGGKEINEALLESLPEILEHASIVHIAGASNIASVSKYFENDSQPDNYTLEELLPHTNLMQYFACSDIVVTRVGASTMAELALLGVATIIIPNPKLTGGHQLKNARRFEEVGSAVVIQQKKMMEDPKILREAILHLIKNDKKQKKLASNLSKLAKPHATRDLSSIILKSASRGE